MYESEVRTGMPVVCIFDHDANRFGIVGTQRRILVKNTTAGPLYCTYIEVIKCNGNSTFIFVDYLTPYRKPKTI